MAYAGAPQVPGFDPDETALISVSCTGFTDSAATDLALCWLTEDIVERLITWPRG
jgi:hypothetical protein